jgi:hypothetical protein
VLRLFRNSASPADDDVAGSIVFSGEDDAGNETDYASIKVITEDVTNTTEDGRLSFNIIDGGSAKEVMSIFDDFVGIGTTAPEQLLHIHAADSGSTYTADSADRLIIEHNDSLRIDMRTGTTNTVGIMFSDTTRNRASISYSHSTDHMTLTHEGDESIVMGGGRFQTGGETSGGVDAGGICINHGANDGLALAFKNSDVSHGMSGATEVDTYGQMQKGSAADGGFRIMGFCDGSADVMQIMGFGATAQTTDTTGSGAMVELFGAKKSGTGIADLASNENLVAFRQYGGTTRFIMKSDGTVHASDTSWATSLDTYDDAQLCRSMDMLPAESTREGFISDKWTQMVKYNIDDLVDAGIYTKDGKDMIEKGETPFFRVQPLLRLHNGAIWQNYTKHQKLAEAVYEMAKEALGEDKADAILEKHDIKLLN